MALLRNSILTKDNLVRRGWKGSVNSYFCGEVEIINHLFISFSIARLIWSILYCNYKFCQKPDCVKELFRGWLRSFEKEKKEIGSSWSSGGPLDVVECS